MALGWDVGAALANVSPVGRRRRRDADEHEMRAIEATATHRLALMFGVPDLDVGIPSLASPAVASAPRTRSRGLAANHPRPAFRSAHRPAIRLHLPDRGAVLRSVPALVLFGSVIAAAVVGMVSVGGPGPSHGGADAAVVAPIAAPATPTTEPATPTAVRPTPDPTPETTPEPAASPWAEPGTTTPAATEPTGSVGAARRLADAAPNPTIAPAPAVPAGPRATPRPAPRPSQVHATPRPTRPPATGATPAPDSPPPPVVVAPPTTAPAPSPTPAPDALADAGSDARTNPTSESHADPGPDARGTVSARSRPDPLTGKSGARSGVSP